jgi:hypothetical protein
VGVLCAPPPSASWVENTIITKGTQTVHPGTATGFDISSPMQSERKNFQLIKNTVLLLHNGGFCNGCITKRILLLQAFHSQENQYYADYDKQYYIFINLIFYHREIVKLDHFLTLSLSYANTVL